MLAEAVQAAPAPDNHAPGFSITGISTCPRGTYINYHQLNPRDNSNHLILEDGNEQEIAILKQLQRAGYEMRNTNLPGQEQAEVYVGKAKVPGHPDGDIIVPTFKWGNLEIKAMNNMRFSYVRRNGLQPSIRNQVQMYMHAKGQPYTWVYIKNKESCEPYDVFEEYDPLYCNEVVQATDTIILDSWEPKPVFKDMCAVCRHAKFCFGKCLIDFSDVPTQEEDSKLVQQWLQGKVEKSFGKDMYDDARDMMVKRLGTKRDVMVVRGIIADTVVEVEVKRIKGSTYKFDELMFADVYGANNLHQVMKKVPTEQIRTREL